MGITYSSWLRVGYSFSDQEILNTFKHVTAPARTITEDRFSSKTGKKLKCDSLTFVGKNFRMVPAPGQQATAC